MYSGTAHRKWTKTSESLFSHVHLNELPLSLLFLIMRYQRSAISLIKQKWPLEPSGNRKRLCVQTRCHLSNLIHSNGIEFAHKFIFISTRGALHRPKYTTEHTHTRFVISFYWPSCTPVWDTNAYILNDSIFSCFIPLCKITVFAVLLCAIFGRCIISMTLTIFEGIGVSLSNYRSIFLQLTPCTTHQTLSKRTEYLSL